MPGYNLINGWTAASLTPGVAGAVRGPNSDSNSMVPPGMAGTNPNIRSTTLNQTSGSNSTFNLPQHGVGGDMLSGLLSSIFGPNYQNLLNTGAAYDPNQNGAVGSNGWSNTIGEPDPQGGYIMTPQQRAEQAQTAFVNSQASLNDARASAIGAFGAQQRGLSQAARNLSEYSSPPSLFGGNTTSYQRNQQAQFDLLSSIIGSSAQVARSAAFGGPQGQGASGPPQPPRNYMVGAPANGNSGWTSTFNLMSQGI